MFMEPSFSVEPNAMRWRAVADILEYEDCGLICFGKDIYELKRLYAESYKYYDSKVKDKIIKIRIEKWEGLPNCGNWRSIGILPIPK